MNNLVAWFWWFCTNHNHGADSSLGRHKAKKNKRKKGKKMLETDILPFSSSWLEEGPNAVLLLHKFGGEEGGNSSKERLQLFTPSSTYWTCFPFALLIFHRSSLRRTFHQNPNESKWRSVPSSRRRRQINIPIRVKQRFFFLNVSRWWSTSTSSSVEDEETKALICQEQPA